VKHAALLAFLIWAILVLIVLHFPWPDHQVKPDLNIKTLPSTAPITGELEA